MVASRLQNCTVKHSCWQQLLDVCRWSAALLRRFSVCSSYLVCPAVSLAALAVFGVSWRQSTSSYRRWWLLALVLLYSRWCEQAPSTECWVRNRLGCVCSIVCVCRNRTRGLHSVQLVVIPRFRFADAVVAFWRHLQCLSDGVSGLGLQLLQRKDSFGSKPGVGLQNQ